MDTIPARATQVAAPPLPVTAPRVGPARDRTVLAAAVLLVVGQLVLRGWLVGQRQYFADDLRLLRLADGSALLSPSYLLHDFDGHLMPGAFLVAGLVERAAPLEWWPAAVSLVVLQALASLALLRVLRVLLGDRPVLLLPLAFGLFTPMVLGNVTWWAAGLNSLPLQIGLAWFVADAVQLARTGRRRYAVSGTAALAFALAFYLKAVLIPPVALGLVAVVLLCDGAPDPLRHAVRRARTLWTGSVVVLVVWAVTYLSTREDDPVGDGTADDVWTTVAHGYEALAPVVVGGPFRWTLAPPGSPLSLPSTGTVVVGALLLGAALIRTCLRRRGAPAVWALTVVGVGAGLLMAGIGRSGLGLGHLTPFAYRYFAADAVLLPIAGALLAVLPARPALRRGSARPVRPRRWSAPVVATSATVLTAAFVGSCVTSTIDHARAWEADRTGRYLDTARASLAAAGPAPLLDQVVPEDVMWPLSAPANRASQVFAPLPDRPRFASSTSELQLLTDSGRLVPAELALSARVLPGPEPGCGHPLRARQSATLPLDAPLRNGEWTVELIHTASRDGVLAVALDDREPVDVPVVAGTAAVYVRLTGAGSALEVTSATDGLKACLHGAAVGWPVR